MSTIVNNPKTSPFHARFGGMLESEPEIPHTDIIDQQLNRSTVRHFIPNSPLPPGTLELLMASAQSAATSGCLQTYSVIALTSGPEKEKLFSNEASIRTIGGTDSENVDAIFNCSVFLIWVADLHRIDFILNAKCRDPEVIKQTTRAEYQLKAIIDATIASQAFAISAESMGLGVMYCGAIRQLEIEELEKSFNLPKSTYPIFGMAIGYPRIDPKNREIKGRLTTDTIIHRGSYKHMTNTDEITLSNEIHQMKFDKDRKIYFKTRWDYINRLVERLDVSVSKSRVSSNLRYMGFNFD